jgi:hypothetical protein
MQGAPVRFKAWVCTDPECGFNLKIRNGDITRDEPIADQAAPAATAVRLARTNGLARAR